MRANNDCEEGVLSSLPSHTDTNVCCLCRFSLSIVIVTEKEGEAKNLLPFLLSLFSLFCKIDARAPLNYRGHFSKKTIHRIQPQGKRELVINHLLILSLFLYNQC